MAFTVGDFNDLLQLLSDHPQWRVELRHMLISEDLEALPALVRELVEAHRRGEERLTRLEESVAQLVEAQRRSEERLARLEGRLDKLEVKLARVDGRTLEQNYRQKAPSYFGRWLRRIAVLDANDVFEAVEDRLPADALHEVLLTDLWVRGRAVQRPGKPEVWLVVEISSVVDRDDVARAVRRAELLRSAGVPALPVVAGENATEGAETAARTRGVALLQDGTALFWDEAFDAWPVQRPD